MDGVDAIDEWWWEDSNNQIVADKRNVRASVRGRGRQVQESWKTHGDTR